MRVNAHGPFNPEKPGPDYCQYCGKPLGHDPTIVGFGEWYAHALCAAEWNRDNGYPEDAEWAAARAPLCGACDGPMVTTSWQDAIWVGEPPEGALRDHAVAWYHPACFGRVRPQIEAAWGGPVEVRVSERDGQREVWPGSELRIREIEAEIERLGQEKQQLSQR